MFDENTNRYNRDDENVIIYVMGTYLYVLNDVKRITWNNDNNNKKWKLSFGKKSFIGSHSIDLRRNVA